MCNCIWNTFLCMHTCSLMRAKFPKSGFPWISSITFNKPAAVKKRYHGKKAIPLCFFRNNFLNNNYFSLQFKLDVNNTAIYTIYKYKSQICLEILNHPLISSQNPEISNQ